MEISKVLKEFVKRCNKELDLYGIIQFGSSTYSKNPHDIDLVLVFNEDIISTKNTLKLIEIIQDFEKRYGEIVFDFAGIEIRKKKGKYSISVVPLGKKDINIFYNPHDLFFFKILNEDKNKKILFGKDPFKKNFNLTNQHLFEMLTVDFRAILRRSLDDEQYKLDSSYFVFKTFLRAMLVNKGQFKKEELLDNFKKEYPQIKLPKNSESIINHQFKWGDFEDIIDFSKECLRWLVK